MKYKHWIGTISFSIGAGFLIASHLEIGGTLMIFGGFFLVAIVGEFINNSV
jgi:hypothetical protein